MRRECFPRVSDPDMRHGTCVTNVPWYMPGSLTCGFIWSRAGKTFPTLQAHAQPAILRIWSEAHSWKHPFGGERTAHCDKLNLKVASRAPQGNVDASLSYRNMLSACKWIYVSLFFHLRELNHYFHLVNPFHNTVSWFHMYTWHLICVLAVISTNVTPNEVIQLEKSFHENI